MFLFFSLKICIEFKLILINKVIKSLDMEHLHQQVEEAYQLPVAGTLPLAKEMIELGSRGVFALNYPYHPLTKVLKTIAHQIIS